MISAIVTGLSTSLLSALGIAGANSVGAEVTQLNPKQVAAITIIGGVVGLAAYLKQSPIPAEEEAK